MIAENPTITCGECHEASDACEWRETPITGELPEEHYQCPACMAAFKRERTGNQWRPIRCVRVASVL